MGEAARQLPLETELHIVERPVIEMALSDVVYREDLYPRIKPDTATIQRYADNIENLPPIEVNQHNILIDGFHRWTAHRKAEAKTIKAIVTATASENELFYLACRRNSHHGLQASEQDKKSSAIRLYAGGTGYSKDEIAAALSVTLRSVNNYLGDVDRQLREERKQRIFDMWLSCHTLEEIANTVSVEKMTVSRQVEECNNLEALPNSYKVNAQFQDESFRGRGN